MLVENNILSLKILLKLFNKILEVFESEYAGPTLIGTYTSAFQIPRTSLLELTVPSLSYTVPIVNTLSSLTLHLFFHV